MSDDTTKTQFAEAKALIQQKRYAEARKILKRIDDPIARQWEAKLDSIAPAAPAASRSAMNYTIVGIVAGVIGLLIGLVIGNTMGSRSAAASTALLPTATAIALIPTATALEPATTVAAPTRDCGAYDWWNANGSEVKGFVGLAAGLVETKPEEIGDFGYDILLDGLDEKQTKFDSVTPPLCADEVQGLIVSAMYNYIFSFQNAELNKSGHPIKSAETPEKYLADARDEMKRAAAQIEALTGTDASFLIETTVAPQ
jgi:hypothetical protein